MYAPCTSTSRSLAAAFACAIALASRAGGYTQVATGPSRAAAGLHLARKTPPRIDLSYGRADVSSFPRAAWLRAIRGALASAPNDLFGYLAGSGVPQLRTAIADYRPPTLSASSTRDPSDPRAPYTVAYRA